MLVVRRTSNLEVDSLKRLVASGYDYERTACYASLLKVDDLCANCLTTLDRDQSTPDTIGLVLIYNF
jgi:hypothetical protein